MLGCGCDYDEATEIWDATECNIHPLFCEVTLEDRRCDQPAGHAGEHRSFSVVTWES